MISQASNDKSVGSIVFKQPLRGTSTPLFPWLIHQAELLPSLILTYIPYIPSANQKHGNGKVTCWTENSSIEASCWREFTLPCLITTGPQGTRNRPLLDQTWSPSCWNINFQGHFDPQELGTLAGTWTPTSKFGLLIPLVIDFMPPSWDSRGLKGKFTRNVQKATSKDGAFGSSRLARRFSTYSLNSWSGNSASLGLGRNPRKVGCDGSSGNISS